jgi:hypothetical protein
MLGFALDVSAVVVGVRVIVSVNGAEVPARKFPSPPYCAVTLWVPPERVEIAMLAEPAAITPEPIFVVPS